MLGYQMYCQAFMAYRKLSIACTSQTTVVPIGEPKPSIPCNMQGKHYSMVADRRIHIERGEEIKRKCSRFEVDLLVVSGIKPVTATTDGSAKWPAVS